MFLKGLPYFQAPKSKLSTVNSMINQAISIVVFPRDLLTMGTQKRKVLLLEATRTSGRCMQPGTLPRLPQKNLLWEYIPTKSSTWSRSIQKDMFWPWHIAGDHPCPASQGMRIAVSQQSETKFAGAMFIHEVIFGISIYPWGSPKWMVYNGKSHSNGGWLGVPPLLVGGLEHQFLCFQPVGKFIIPTDFHIFFRGVAQPPTCITSWHMWQVVA